MNKLQKLKDEIKSALKELEAARNYFENADDDFIDVAIYELMAKRKKLDTLIKKAKECA